MVRNCGRRWDCWDLSSGGVSAVGEGEVDERSVDSGRATRLCSWGWSQRGSRSAVFASIAWMASWRPRLLPASVVVSEPAHMGDIVRVELPFVNRTWRTITLTGFTRSCGCTDAVDAADKSIQYPVVVAHQGKNSWRRCRALSAGRPLGLLFSGKNRYHTDDARYPTVQLSQIDIQVRAGWCPSGTVIRVGKSQQESDATAVVLIGDTYPGAGVEVDSVRSTSEQFKVRCVPPLAGSAAEVAIPHWTPRYCVTVEYLGGDSNAGPEAYVWVYRKDGKDSMRLGHCGSAASDERRETDCRLRAVLENRRVMQAPCSPSWLRGDGGDHSRRWTDRARG